MQAIAKPMKKLEMPPGVPPTSLKRWSAIDFEDSRQGDARRGDDTVWSFEPDRYGRLGSMKKTFNIDARLLTEAKEACGARTDTDTIRLGLEALVRHAAYQRLAALGGSEPFARDVPRRREAASRSRKRRVA